MMGYTSHMLAALLSLTLAAPAPALVIRPVTLGQGASSSDDGSELVVEGDKALYAHGRILWLLSSDGKVLRKPRVPAHTTSAGLCRGDIYVTDDRGLVRLDESGDTVVIAAVPLMSVADPHLIPLVPICPGGAERVLPVKGGALVVDDATSEAVLLPFSHRARAYGHRGERTLRGDRPYAAALSVYAPQTLAVDVTGDGQLDLVFVHEHSAHIFVRGSSGALAQRAVSVDLSGDVTIGDTDVRVLDSAHGLVVARSRGTLPETTSLMVLNGDAAARPLKRVVGKHSLSGSAFLLGSSNGSAIVGRVDTSLVSLSGVMLSGRASLELHRVHKSDTIIGTIPIVADVRQGSIKGALPVVDVDLDGDGTDDIIDLGEPGVVVWRSVTDGALKEMGRATLRGAVLARGMPKARAVVVVGSAGVMFIRVL